MLTVLWDCRCCMPSSSKAQHQHCIIIGKPSCSAAPHLYLCVPGLHPSC